MLARRRNLWIGLSSLIIVAMVVAGCGGATPGAQTTGGEEAATSGCPEPDPRMEVTSQEVNLFVWTEYIPQDTIDCFEEVYGIKVNQDEYSSNEEMYAKLSAGGANYDLVQPSDYLAELMIRQGMLQELDQEKLAVMGNMDPAYLDLPFDPGNKYTVPYQAGTDAIVVNTDKVETVPESFADLWNPEYAGRLIMLDDSRTVIGMALLTLGYDVNTTDPAQLEAAKVKLQELAPGVKIFDSDSPKTALIAGDADLGLTWTAEAELAHREIPAVQYVYPAEGAILWQDNYAMPKDAPHPDAAYAWMNYTLQGDVFWQMLVDFPYSMPNKAALDFAKEAHPDLYELYINSNITNTPPEAIEEGHRMTDVGDATPLYDRVWTEVKGG